METNNCAGPNYRWETTIFVWQCCKMFVEGKEILHKHELNGVEHIPSASSGQLTCSR